MKHGSRKVVGDMGAKRGNKDGNKTSASCKTINQRAYCCPQKSDGIREEGVDGKCTWIYMILIYRDQSQIMIYGSRKVARDMEARRGNKNHGIRKFRQWIVIGNQKRYGIVML
jgi:hypothetical protein